jgi:LytR cell envelope-related transcriptional attenuator
MKSRGRLLATAGAIAVVVGTIAISRPWDRSPPRAPVVDASGRVAPGTRIRVEVLNASDVSGLAGEATEHLREGGFDVVYFGNATEPEDSSSVIDRIGDLEMAQAVANALGIRNVFSEPDSNLFVDVSVMLGSEWLTPDVAPEATRVERARWDPRGWFR